jgi:hypothetical protein
MSWLHARYRVRSHAMDVEGDALKPQGLLAEGPAKIGRKFALIGGSLLLAGDGVLDRTQRPTAPEAQRLRKRKLPQGRTFLGTDD